MHGKVLLGWFGLLIVLGSAMALMLEAFEFVVTEGTQWLWNDILQSDTHRWRVVPIALVGSVLLGLLFRSLSTERLVKPHVDLTAPAAKSQEPPTLSDIGKVAALGMASLVAGASLGPEASVMAMAEKSGAWAALKARYAKYAELLSLASVGALLVAFVGSLIPVLFPLVILAQKHKLSRGNPRETAFIVFSVALTSTASMGTFWLLDHGTSAYGDIPLGPNMHWVDWPLAFGVGIVAAGIGWLLKRLIMHLANFAKRVNTKTSWLVTSGLFGLIIGILYLFGGESVQFSGSVGSNLLAHEAGSMSIAALFGVLAVKLMVTGWSLATGYRGGLVFPSIYMGVAIGLIAEALFDVSGAGIMLGAIGGIFGALVGPIGGAIFITSVIPWQLIPIAIVGILGAAVGNQLITKATSPS